MEIRVVGVLGCGLMGSGIAQVCAANGYRTIVRDVSESVVEAGLANVRTRLQDAVKKGRLSTEARDEALNNLVACSELDDLSPCGLVIEAIVENLADKSAAYAAVEPVLTKDAIIASNTSSLSITELAATTRRPDRFGGLHFFNPAPAMKLVEVIAGQKTAEETFNILQRFAISLGKEAVSIADRPGFAVNRLLIPYLLDAIRLHETNLAAIEDLDKAMTLGCGHPIGPFRLLDLIGLDTTYHIANALWEEFREPRFAPPPLLKRMVIAGQLGKKSGQGFFRY